MPDKVSQRELNHNRAAFLRKMKARAASSLSKESNFHLLGDIFHVHVHGNIKALCTIFINEAFNSENKNMERG